MGRCLEMPSSGPSGEVFGWVKVRPMSSQVQSQDQFSRPWCRSMCVCVCAGAENQNILQ